MASLVALILGLAVSQIRISPQSPLAPLAFEGIADDARALLTTISGTVVTVTALVLSLTVVALQLASTQSPPFSPSALALVNPSSAWPCFDCSAAAQLLSATIPTGEPRLKNRSC
jgi:uncharacterized membrane protein